jgi:4a-hydroxytetrahydrobiopterin dehydratase
MTQVARLDPKEITQKLAVLPDWELRDDAVHRRFEFRDFVEAFSFMTAVALVAERMGHHPEWSNVYNVVTVRLTTHDAGGLSEDDFVMAEEMSRLHRHLAG